MAKKPKKIPKVRLVTEIPSGAVEVLRKNGLFRCGVATPACNGQPYAEVERSEDRPPPGKRKLRSLFCLRHSIHFCGKYGFRLPLPEEN